MSSTKETIFGWTLIGGIVAGFAGIGYTIRDAKKKGREERDKQVEEMVGKNFCKEGTAKVWDVNGDGLEDLVFGYKSLTGEQKQVIFYNVNKEYFTGEQLKERAIKETAEKYSGKVRAEEERR